MSVTNTKRPDQHVLGTGKRPGRCWKEAVAILMIACQLGTGVACSVSPQGQPTAVLLLADLSGGNVFTSDDVLGVLHQAAWSVAPGGGKVELWVLGPDVGSTLEVFEASCPPLRKRSRYAVRTHRERFAGEVVKGASPVVAGVFGHPRPRQSPVAGGLTKLALARPSGHVIVVYLGDLYEVSGGQRRGSALDLECGPVPDDATLATWLHRQGLLTEGSLTGVAAVLIGFADVAPVDKDRCPTDVSRRLAVNALFVNAIYRAGAGAVSVTTGAPVIDSAAIGAAEGSVH